MSRPRTPTSVLEQRGAFINHPERREERADEPVPNSDIRKSAPPYLTSDEKKVWREFIKKVTAGVLGDCDEYILAMAVRMEWKERSGTIKTSERAQYMQMLTRLGMTPADRSKVIARPLSKAEDDWAELDAPETTM